MPNQMPGPPQETKPYDTTVKAAFSKWAGEIIACLVPGVRLRQGLPDDLINVELNRNMLAIDVGLHVELVEKYLFGIANVETQSGPDDDLFARMNEYTAHLYRIYHVVIIPIALFLFECAIPVWPFEIGDGEHVYTTFRPRVICMWTKDPQQVVAQCQYCLYMFLPLMKNPQPELLKSALRDLRDQYNHEDFVQALKWFGTMLHRTTTMSAEDKQEMEVFLDMQFQFNKLLVEDPVVNNIAAEREAKGKAEGRAEGVIEGIRGSIIEIACDCFSDPVIAAVRQTIASVQNEQKLKKFLRRLVHAASDQEVFALLSECFPLAGEIKGLQDGILALIPTRRFSPQLASTVQQAIASVENVQQLRDFLCQLAVAPDEQAIPSLLAQFFPESQSSNPSANAEPSPSAKTVSPEILTEDSPLPSNAAQSEPSSSAK